MTVVQAVVPDPWINGSKVTGVASEDDETADVSLVVPSVGGSTFTIRTLVRLGERINSAGFPHGTMTDDVSVATLAVTSRLLQDIPAGLARDEVKRRMQSLDDDAHALARDRAAWTFAALVVRGGATYALWHRSLAGGFVAHADLGPHVLAAWGECQLPAELLRVQLMDLDSRVTV